VLVALAGESRGDILSATKESIHLYKTRPLIFKKEVYGDGTGRWIEGD
jgi:molybdopterin synthase catalytic subunit